MNTILAFSDIILKSFKLSFQHLDRFCTGGQLEVAVVVLINGDHNVNLHRERKPAKVQLDDVFWLESMTTTLMEMHSRHKQIQINAVGVLIIKFRLSISHSETYM